MIDEFGYMEGDATESNTNSTDPSRTMTVSDLNEMGSEDDYSLSTEDTLDDLSCDDTEEKSKKSKKSESSSKKKGKGKKKRGAAGGDDPVKKDGAAPVVVKIEDGKGSQVKIGEIKGEVPGLITATKSDNQWTDGQTKKNSERGEKIGNLSHC